MPFLVLLLASALFISGVAAWFSIVGLMAIFSGSAMAIAVMGTALEVGKLVTASWLYRSWKKSALLLKTYFIAAVFILCIITSIGIFGYLSRAHIEGNQVIETGAGEVALVQDQITMEEQNIASLTVALTQIDGVVAGLIANERLSTAAGAVNVRNRQRAERAQVVSQISESNAKILDLKRQITDLNAGQRQLETEIGPIKYFAQLVYQTDDAETIEKAVRMLIVILVFVFDPLAILLVVAANMQFREWKESRKKVSPHFGTTRRLEEPIEDPKTTTATWSPVGDAAVWYPVDTPYETTAQYSTVESPLNLTTHGDGYLLVKKEDIEEL